MSSHNDHGADEFFQTALFWMSLILIVLLFLGIAAFIVSTWLTRLLLQWVLLPLWRPLERQDGLVVVISSALWSAVGLGVYTYLLSTGWLQLTPDQITQGWAVSLVTGAVWGALVATWILIVWWEEIIAHQTPPPAFTGVLGLSPDFYQSPEAETEEIESLEQLEAEFLQTWQVKPVAEPMLVR
jgi:hypothetical protein